MLVPVRKQPRRGAALVEFAICLPVLILLVFASIEASSMIFLKQSLSVAGYEGLRVAIRPEATLAEARARCEGILDDRGVNDYTIDINPAPEKALQGLFITIRIETPSAANSLLPGWFFAGKTIHSENSMVKE